MSTDTSVSGGKIWNPPNAITPAPQKASFWGKTKWVIERPWVVIPFLAILFACVASPIIMMEEEQLRKEEAQGLSFVVEWAATSYNYEIIDYNDGKDIEVKNLDDGITKTVNMYFTEAGAYLAESEADLNKQIEEQKN